MPGGEELGGGEGEEPGRERRGTLRRGREGGRETTLGGGEELEVSEKES